MPKPNKNEKKSDFISRYINSKEVKSKHKDKDQRLAIAYSIWDKAKNESVLDKYLAKVYNEILMPNERKKAQEAGLIDPREKSPDERTKIGSGSRFIAKDIYDYDVIIYKNPTEKDLPNMLKELDTFYRGIIVKGNVYFGQGKMGTIHKILMDALINAKEIAKSDIPGYEDENWDPHTDSYLCITNTERNKEFILSDLYNEDIPNLSYKRDEVEGFFRILQQKCPWAKILRTAPGWDNIYDSDWKIIKVNNKY